MTSSKNVVIGLAGLGTVGSGLVQLLKDNAEEIEQRTGKKIVVKYVAVRNTNTKRDIPEGAKLIDNPLLMVEDPEVQVVVELMGGLGMADMLIRQALENGKSVVTANKALLAERGEELFALAEEKNLSLAYEASVAGAIPVVQTLKDSLAGNKINTIFGILNGTSNYILSEMSAHGTEFSAALKNAQDLGYAEADPTLDIDGFDAAHKLKLLIRLAWGVHYPYEKLPVQGIRDMSAMDIAFARSLGYSIKLLGQASRIHEEIEAGVSPVLIPEKAMLARVDGAFNAIHINGNAVGSLFLHGLGAGSLPTASAVLGDIMSLMKDIYDSTGYVMEKLPLAPMANPDKTEAPWYLRLMVHDTVGVLRDIAGIFAKHSISIAQVIQKKKQENGVPLVFMTHETSVKAMKEALHEIEATNILNCRPVAFRVLDLV